RLFTRDRDTHIDAALFSSRIASAVARRKAIGLPSNATDAYRLIHAEGDDLPGVIVDRYGDVVVVQIGTIGIKRREAAILDALEAELRPRAIVDRTSERAANTEGFQPASGVVRGDASITELSFVERGLRFRIPFDLGQKTGFYVDQREL